MTEELTDEDFMLIKDYFSEENSSTLEEHRNTPSNVLEILLKQPTKSIGNALPLVSGLLIFFLGFSATFDFEKYSELRYINFVLIMGGIILLGYSILRIINEMTRKEEEWLLFTFMIELRKNSKNAENIRLYLKNHNNSS